MVVGLVVVGFGTSMPEFAVSVVAASRGSGGLSLGNAVGSNIMNLLLVLGVVAVLIPIHVIGSGQASDVKHTFSPVHCPGFAGGFPGARGIDHLARDGLRFTGIFH